MCADAHRFCQGCLTCATYQGAGRSHVPPLRPIPIGGSFETVGVDVLEMPQTERGASYAIAFVDKWVEAYAVCDQTSETIAALLIGSIVCRHGVPMKLLSDRGANF